MQSSPLNPKRKDDTLTVTNGKIELHKPASIVHVGLPVMFKMRLLPLDYKGDESIQEVEKNVMEAVVSTYQTRGLWVGVPDDGQDENDLTGFVEELPRDVKKDKWGLPQMRTGPQEIPMHSKWTPDAGVEFAQPDPLPVEIVSAKIKLLIPAENVEDL